MTFVRVALIAAFAMLALTLPGATQDERGESPSTGAPRPMAASRS